MGWTSAGAGVGQGVAAAEAASSRSELLARLPDPLRHRCLSGAAPCSRVEAVLVPDPAVDPGHTFPVVEHMTGERPGERALVVGVDLPHHPQTRPSLSSVRSLDKHRRLKPAARAGALWPHAASQPHRVRNQARRRRHLARVRRSRRERRIARKKGSSVE